MRPATLGFGPSVISRFRVPVNAPMKAICMPIAPITDRRRPLDPADAWIRMKPLSVSGPIWISAWIVAVT